MAVVVEGSNDDDDFGEEVFTGKVKAATLPFGGPASRRVKRPVEGGPIARGRGRDVKYFCASEIFLSA